MLMTFAHLFPASTDQWQPAAQARSRPRYLCRATLWVNFADFYRQAPASQIAYKASRAKSDSEFRKTIAGLRNACDSCHAVYLKIDQ